MATSKTLTPTNVTIQIPAMTDAPDQSVNSNCIDKLGDAVNTLNSNLYPYNLSATTDTLKTYTLNDTTSHNDTVTATHNGFFVVRLASEPSALEIFVRASVKGVGYSNTYNIPAYYAEPIISIPCHAGDILALSYKKQTGANNATLVVQNNY